MSANFESLHSSVEQHEAHNPQITEYMVGHGGYMNPGSGMENGNNNGYMGPLMSSDLQSAENNIFGNMRKQTLGYHGMENGNSNNSIKSGSDPGIIDSNNNNNIHQQQQQQQQHRHQNNSATHTISGENIIDNNKKSLTFASGSQGAIDTTGHFDLSLLGQNMGSNRGSESGKKLENGAAFDQIAEITKTTGDININEQSLNSSLDNTLNAELNSAINSGLSTTASTRRKPANSQNLSLQNFHLDPQDFQNFLMINPPLVEYSPYYYMMTMNGNNPESAANVANAAASAAQQNHHQLSNQNQGQAQNVNQNQSLGHAQISRNVSQTQGQGQAQINHHSQMSPQGQQGGTQMDQMYGYRSRSSDGGFQAAYPGQQMNSNESYAKIQQPQPRVVPRSALFNHRQSTNFERPQSTMPGPEVGMGGTNMRGSEQMGAGDAEGPAVAYPPAPRRRLSISNGQIGQISMIVHRSEAQGEQLRGNNGSVGNSETVASSNPDTTSRNISVKSELPISVPHVQNSQGTSVPVARTQPSSGLANPQVLGHSEIEVDKDGVPKRQLIYNNQVIFNPNAGPIPGTAAWKRQRILERNRIAASRCRQKKKNLQKRLQQDVKSLKRKKQYLEIVLLGLREKMRKYMEESGTGLDEILGHGSEDFQLPELDKDSDDYMSSSDERKGKSTKNRKGGKRNAAFAPPRVTTDTLRKILSSEGDDIYADLGSG